MGWGNRQNWDKVKPPSYNATGADLPTSNPPGTTPQVSLKMFLPCHTICCGHRVREQARTEIFSFLKPFQTEACARKLQFTGIVKSLSCVLSPKLSRLVKSFEGMKRNIVTNTVLHLLRTWHFKRNRISQCLCLLTHTHSHKHSAESRLSAQAGSCMYSAWAAGSTDTVAAHTSLALPVRCVHV